MGRINAWHMAFNLAADRPLVGGGYEIYNRISFARWAPDPDDLHAAHSIYFQALGEHGFVGLGLYLWLAFATWRKGSWVIRQARGRPEFKWAADLATMIQVSMIGFATGGAFLSLLYYDVPYYLMAAMVVVVSIVERALAEEIAAKGTRVAAAAAQPALATGT
jgi:probable O-glycosylation ligase (exosortase A-associated)